MADETEAILAQIHAALARVQELDTHHAGNLGNADQAELLEAETACIAAIERLAPKGSRYREAVQESVGNWTTAHTQIVRDCFGILSALRSDYAAGYLRSVRELVHADIFADFLEMAAYLLDSGYKDPAAVVAGSALEVHLRQLAEKAEMNVTDDDGRPLKAERLNADLAEARIYEKGDQKSVTAWLDTRNNAAHGHYDRYAEGQAGLLIDGIRDFIRRFPA